MKVIMISGSPHKEGGSRLALREMEKVFAAEGIESELIEVGAGPVSGCTACGACKKTGVCVIGDRVNEAIEKLAAADALVVATPVHYASPAGALLAFLDRMFYAGGSKFAHKPRRSLCQRAQGRDHGLARRYKQVFHHQPDAHNLLHLLEYGLRLMSGGRGAGRRGPADRAQSRPEYCLAAPLHRGRQKVRHRTAQERARECNELHKITE